MTKINTPEIAKIDVEATKKAIRALESPKIKRDRERTELFEVVYPEIRDQLEAAVSKSAIIKTLTDCGMSISVSMFDAMLAAEAKRRGEPVPGKGAYVASQTNKEAT